MTTVKIFMTPHESVCAKENRSDEAISSTTVSLLDPNPPNRCLHDPSCLSTYPAIATGRPNRSTRNMSSSHTAAWVKSMSACSSVRLMSDSGVSTPIPNIVNIPLRIVSSSIDDPKSSPIQNRGVVLVFSM